MMSSTMGRAGNYVFSPLGGVGPSTAKRNFLSDDSAGDDELEAYGFSPDKKSSAQKLPSAGQSALNATPTKTAKATNKFVTSLSNPHDLLSFSNDEVDHPSQPSAAIRHVHEDTDYDIITPRGVIKSSPRASMEGTLYEEGSTSVKLTYNKKTKETDTTATTPQKQQFGNQSTVVYNQRVSATKSPGPTIDKEKEELLAALEVLKMQNQLLTSKIEKTQIESLNQIEQERNAKRALQMQLELENNRLKDQLMQSKLSAEEQLAREKEAFLAKLAQMEAEKSSLQVRMQEIEEQSILDANILRMQRSEMLDSIQKLEEERISLHRKLSENTDVAAQLSEENTSHTAAAAELQKQRDELSQLLDKLEKDKALLAASLQDTETKARENEKILQEKLAEEQRMLNTSLAVMETEKQSLLEKLISSEREAEAHSEAMNRMLSEEQRKTQTALEELEHREKQLAEAQAIAQAQAAVAAAAAAAVTPLSAEALTSSSSSAAATSPKAASTASISPKAAGDVSSSGTTKISPHNANSSSSISGGSDKKAQMEAEMARIKEEREELQAKLAASLNNKHQTELVSRLHNKLQLKKSVLRMKEELMAERNKQQQQQQQSSSQKQETAASPELKFSRFPGATSSVEINAPAVAVSKTDGSTSPPPPAAAAAAAAVVINANASEVTPTKPKSSAASSSLSQIFAITPTSSNRSLATTNSTTSAAAGAGHNASSRVLISPKKSLYDVLENSNAATLSSGMYDILSTGSSATEGVAMHPRATNSYSKIHLTRRSQQFHQVEKIDEVDERTFMDWDSDEEDGKQGSKSGKTSKNGGPSATAGAGAAVIGAPGSEAVGVESTEPKTAEELEAELIASLPSPHAAAATGNMKKLEALCNLDTSLLKSLDSGGRKPLFYAAAYGQIEALKFLIHLFPDLVSDCDIHYDTALHAATSSGNAEIAEMLIIAAGGTKESAEPRNSLEMTPAHLASTAECLDVLYRYEADICAMDAHLRSPLFVACAMNRVDCTEYLVNCLDNTTTGLSVLLAKDKRGDTPLHAAACNGSEDCLLLLLQYGIDPRMINDIGLKAIDLAIRNNHMKCKTILAEYYLHYCTSSEFDSVLFLATLEGHRMISEMNNTSQVSDVAGSYQIIKKNSKQSLAGLTSGEGSPTKSLQGGDRKLDPFAQSMFSLRAVKSLRLERWGAWIAYHDQQSQTVFWYNHESNQGQWSKPEQVTLMQISSREKKDYFDKTLQAKSSMRLTKMGDWIKYVTESGKTFFYNVVTNDFQWDDPTGTDHAKAAAGGGGYGSNENSQKSGGSVQHPTNTSDDNNNNAASVDSANPWRPYLDEETDTVFWYNSVTQVSQWECPFDNPTAAVGTSLSPSFEDEQRGNGDGGDGTVVKRRRSTTNSFDEYDGDNAVFLVNHENDLDL